MSKPVKVRVIREFGNNWNMHKIGEVLEMDGGIRDIRLRRGDVELVEVEVETAAIATGTRRRKRRRKTRTRTH